MSRVGDQKAKLIYLYQYLAENTDEKHGVTMEEILEYLQKKEISAERKSIYADLDVLRSLGCDIDKDKTKNTTYRLMNRDLELSELKILVDAVQASKFLTVKRSQKLIEKLEQMTSKYHRKELDRQVYVVDRVKSTNDEIFHIIDCIHRGISENCKIRFLYQKKKHDISEKVISPWYLCWSEQNYYMIGFDTEAGIQKTYRVDRMRSAQLVPDQPRDGRAVLEQLNLAEHMKTLFGMYSGEKMDVTLRIAEKLENSLLDRFGDDMSVRPDLEHKGYLIVHAQVSYSQQFIGWLLGLGPEDAVVLSPERIRQDLVAQAETLMRLYQK